MACKTWEPMIALDAGGDLSAANAAKLARHLTACTACQRFAEEMRESRQAVALLADAPVDEAALAAVRAGVLHELDNTGGRSTATRLFLAPRVLALAAMIAMALGALLLLRSGGPHLPHPRPQVTEAPTVPQPPVPPQPSEAATSSVEAATEDQVAAVREPVEAATSQPRPPIALSPVTSPPAIRTVAPAPTATVTKAEPPTFVLLAGEPAATEPTAPESMFIKLISEDADLVIYWLVNIPDETPHPSRGTTKETNDEISAV